MHLRYTLGLDEAVVAVAAGLAAAAHEGWAVTIAVVDDAGIPLHLSRSDGAPAASVPTAIGKASTAAQLGLETKLLEEVIRERPAVATLDRVAVEGGVPILHKDQRVGG
jgi:glc operon protein GlcG